LQKISNRENVILNRQYDFFVLIEEAEQFLLYDLTKKRAARRNAKTLTLSFPIFTPS
jgi:hypothetical protein